MPDHKNLSLAEIHQIHNVEYTDMITAQSASWGASDVGKVFRILDEPNYYLIRTSGGKFMQIGTEEVATVETTDATETTIDTYSTATDFIYYVKVYLLGTVDEGGNAASYRMYATFKNDSGTLTQVGATVNSPDEDDAAWGSDIDANGTNIRVRVIGKAATNINWVSYTSIKVFANGA